MEGAGPLHEGHRAIKARGVRVIKTPEGHPQGAARRLEKTIATLSADPFFKKVVESQQAWAKRVVGFQMDYEAPQQMAYDSFFKA